MVTGGAAAGGEEDGGVSRRLREGGEGVAADGGMYACFRIPLRMKTSSNAPTSR